MPQLDTFDLQTWTIGSFHQQYAQYRTLEISPDIQRKEVWPSRKKTLLIDSIARDVPLGAITLYETTVGGVNKYEVIDGKQRLSTILSYMEDKFHVDEKVVENEDEYVASINEDLAKHFKNKTYGELPENSRTRFLQYKLPVFVLRGDRKVAVQSFTRMNKDSTSLKPQEIRNAIFVDSNFLRTAENACEQFTDSFDEPPTFSVNGHEHQSALVNLGMVSGQNYIRMGDIELMSQLIILELDGAQHRRDKLDEYYESYKAKSGRRAEDLKKAANQVSIYLDAIINIFEEGSRLKAFGIRNEEDFYALIGAFKKKRMTKRKSLEHAVNLASALTVFFEEVIKHTAVLTGADEATSDVVNPGVESYTKLGLGGQRNSKTRREERIAILSKLIGEIMPTSSTEDFPSQIRDLIWAKSPDKKCARCKKVVPYEEYHAGHIVPKSKGGRPVISNGQVEHMTCNTSAGDRE